MNNNNQSYDVGGGDSQFSRRNVPTSGIDMNMMLIDTLWGSKTISTPMKDKLLLRYKNKHGDSQDKEAAWELLTFLTRDLRLANLSGSEMMYCQYYLDLAADLIREGFPEAFATCVGRVASVLELSQSKGGFLRKRQNTLTTESLSGELDNDKKKLLSFGRSKR